MSSRGWAWEQANREEAEAYMAENRPQPTYGLRDVIPYSAKAAWGARLIHQEVIDGGRGVVADRQDAVGDEESRSILLAHLNANQNIRDAIEDYAKGVSGAERAKTVVFSDDAVAVVASPNGSWGYLYVTAYLKEVT